MVGAWAGAWWSCTANTRVCSIVPVLWGLLGGVASSSEPLLRLIKSIGWGALQQLGLARSSHSWPPGVRRPRVTKVWTFSASNDCERFLTDLCIKVGVVAELFVMFRIKSGALCMAENQYSLSLVLTFNLRNIFIVLSLFCFVYKYLHIFQSWLICF